MTADFSVVIKNGHSKIIIINSLKAASKIELNSLTKVMKSFIVGLFLSSFFVIKIETLFSIK